MKKCAFILLFLSFYLNSISQNSDTVNLPIPPLKMLDLIVIDTSQVEPSNSINIINHTSHISVSPSLNSLDINKNTNILVKFTENPFNPATVILHESFKVIGECSGEIDGQISFSSDNRFFTFVPEKQFTSGEIVRVIISSKIEYADGIAIFPFISQFTIGFAENPAQFIPPVSQITGPVPMSVFASDLDMDGDLDLVVPNSSRQSGSYSKTISVFKNKGNGTFYDAVQYETGNTATCPHSVYAEDLNGDKYPDIAVANLCSWTLTILFNNGDGTFTFDSSYATGVSPLRLKIYDLDGDGDGDIVVTNANSRTFSVHKNRGNGTFEPLVEYYVGLQAYGIYVYDIDNDGDGDVITTTTHQFLMSVFLNNGDGTFQPRIPYPVGFYPRDVYVSDLNGDGYGDIVVTNQGSERPPYVQGSITIYMNQKNGSFNDRQDFLCSGMPVGVMITDIDGDGTPDIMSSNHFLGGGIDFWRNRGDGIFNFRETIPLNSPVDFTVADIDNDGDGDIISVPWFGNTIDISLNDKATLKGLVFNDLDSNGVRNTDESGLEEFMVKLEGNGTTQFANSNYKGEFYFITEPGMYSMSLVVKDDFKQTFPISDEGKHLIQFSDPNEIKNSSFGFGVVERLACSDEDLYVNIESTQSAGVATCDTTTCPACTSSTPPCQCVAIFYTLDFRAECLGLNPQNNLCTLTVTLPNEVRYVSTSHLENGQWVPTPPSSINGGTITYNRCTSPINTIFYGYIIIKTEIEADMSCFNSTCPTLNATATFKSPEDDGTQEVDGSQCDCTFEPDCGYLYNDPNKPNTNTACDTLRYCGPYDPNSKILISPEPDNLCPATVNENEIFIYQINFQNIGSAPAKFVTVIDTIDTDIFDLETFSNLNISHTYSFSILESRILKWTFKNINLPGIEEDGLASSGYIKYKIQFKKNLSDFIVIKNRASIYFDYNSPIATNLTIHLIGDSIPMKDWIAESDQAICFGNKATLTAFEGLSYQWSTGETTRSIDVSIQGIYSVKIFFTSGCFVNDSVFITVIGNVVNNGNFENGEIPATRGKIKDATGWYGVLGDPDLFDRRFSCRKCEDAGCVGIPCNYYGFRESIFLGSNNLRYTGLWSSSGTTGQNSNTTKNSDKQTGERKVEAIETKLSEPLIPGNLYKIQLFASVSGKGKNGMEDFSEFAVFTVKLSKTPHGNTTHHLFPNDEIVVFYGFIRPGDWSLFEYLVLVEESYQYLRIESYPNSELLPEMRIIPGKKLEDEIKIFTKPREVNIKEAFEQMVHDFKLTNEKSIGDFISGVVPEWQSYFYLDEISMVNPFCNTPDPEQVQRSSRIMDTLSISAIDKALETLLLYPNPATGTMNLVFDSDVDSYLKLSIFNITGKEILTQSVLTSKGKNNYEINFNEQKDGLYLLKIIYNHKIYTRVFVKSR